jgi:hypothetical protein
MKTLNFCATACRYCNSYQPEGRRGGMCQKLGVPVQAHWKACSLVQPLFTSSWEKFDEVALLEKSFSLKSATLKSEPVLQAS